MCNIPKLPIPPSFSFPKKQTQTTLEMPVGSVITFVGKILQEEGEEGNHNTDLQRFHWKVCDGRTLHRDEFPELYNALGYLYGGQGEQFNLPDLRGTFLRGVGSYPGSVESRTASSPDGDASGVGSSQSFAVQTHQHQYEKPSGGALGESGSAFASKQTDLTSTPTNNIQAIPGEVKVSDIETRPDNTFVYYLIKCAPCKPSIYGS